MTNPAEITDQVLQFCLELVPGESPVWVRFDPQQAGKVDECYENVAAMVHRRGGRILLGWTIWEWSGVVLEATFHAVWEGENGELIDPTPKADGEMTTLFLPDRNAIDSGGVIPSRHFPLKDWPEIGSYIDACRSIGEAQQHYHSVYNGVPVEVLGPLQLRMRELVAAITQKQTRETVRNQLARDVATTESEAASRLSASPADVEASTSLAQHLASRGEFGAAFSVLLRTAEIDSKRASQVRETFLQLFEACDDQSMANEFRRQLSMLLY